MFTRIFQIKEERRMNRKSGRVLSLFLALVLAMTTMFSSFAYAKGASPSLNKKSLELTVGKSKTLKVKKAGGKAVTWSSSKPSVATVSASGKVTAVKKGSAKITAKVGGKKLTCKVKVKGAKIKKTLLNATTITLTKGSTFRLKAIASPIGAENRGFTFKTSKKKVATVSKKGVIKAKKAGTTTITVVSKTGKKKAKCKVKVVNAGAASNNSRAQAVSVAREYLKSGKQTFNSLVSELKKDGFTQADAEAAARAVGLVPAGSSGAKKIIYSVAMTYDAQYMVKGRKADRSLLTVTAKYSDGSTRVLSASEYTLSEGVASNGMYFITVTAGGASASKYMTILDEDPSTTLVSLSNAQFKEAQPVAFADMAKLNVTKFTVDANYSDGSKKTVTPQGMSVGTVKSTDTSATVSLTYGGKETSITLTVVPESQGGSTENVQSISNAKFRGTQPVAYSALSDLDMSQFTVDAKYTDGSTKTVTPQGISTGTVKSSDTSVVVTLTFGGKSTTITLSLTPQTPADPTEGLVSISNGKFTGSQPVAFDDISGINLSQFTVDAKYSDGSTKTVAPTGMSAGTVSSTATSAVITLSLGGKTTTVTIQITPSGQADPSVNVESISNAKFTGSQPVAYSALSDLNLSQFTVDAKYTDGSTKTVTPQGMSMGSVSSTATSATVTLTLGGKSTTITLSVTPEGQGSTDAQLTKVDNPQYSGSQPIAFDDVSKLDMSQFTVDAHYSDGSKKTVKPQQMAVKTVQSTDTTATVILTYGGMQTTATLTVRPGSQGGSTAELKNISNAKYLGTQPVPYAELTNLKSSQFTVQANYTDNTSKTVTPTGMSLGSVSSTATSATVTLTYGGKSAIMSITVLPGQEQTTAELQSISNPKFTGTQPVAFDDIPKLELSQFTVDAKYSDGTTKTVTPLGMSSASVKSTDTSVEITLSYRDKSVKITLAVTPKSAEETEGSAKIAWTGLPKTMKAGQTGSYPATITSSGAGNYTWTASYTSSDPTVLSIDRSGNTVAKKEGTAILTARLLRDGEVMKKSDGTEVNCVAQITVEPDNGKVASITLEYVGSYTVIPNDYDIGTDTASWKVTEKYANGTAIAQNSADFENCAIEISNVDLDAETMTVKAYIVSQPGIMAEVTMPYEVKYETQPGETTQRGYKWDSGKKTMMVGEELSNPATNTVGVVMKYESSNPSVASVSGDGVITALSEGTTTITVTPYKAEAPNEKADGLQTATGTVKVVLKPTGAVARYKGATAPMSGFAISMDDVEVKYICSGEERSISDYPGTSVSVGEGKDIGERFEYKVKVTGKYGTFTTSVGVPHIAATSLEASFNNGMAINADVLGKEGDEETKARFRVIATYADGSTKELESSAFTVEYPKTWNVEGENEATVVYGKGDNILRKTVIIVVTSKNASQAPEEAVIDGIEETAEETVENTSCEAQDIIFDPETMTEEPAVETAPETAMEAQAEPAVEEMETAEEDIVIEEETEA